MTPAREQLPTPRAVARRQFVRWGIGIFVCYYLLNVLFDAVFFDKGTFIEQILRPSPREIAIRLLSGLALSAGLSYGWFSLKKARRNAEALQQSHQQLRQAYRDLEMFSHALAHDLRGNLTSLRVASEVLSNELDGKELASPRLIVQSVERLERTVTALIQLSQLERVPLKKELVNLSHIVAVGLEHSRSALTHRHIEYEVTPNLCTWGDEAMLTVALENLVCNAVKYSANSDPAIIRFGTVPHASGVAFCLEDNGCGFPGDCANRIFLPFQRLHKGNEYPGSGIGLATVQRIIERHGGRIWAEGRPGEGARLFFTLPTKS
ncbi:histidine kinase/DNA gyrase B/HSP90-like ATPase [Geothermobacter ehrlichii]|uniref:histidine kinase n=1 Tax=Geothermobacter ehrlichii TaxID=213224 RepID=A0A5D3WNV2_9BACT|nr:ATP-binding protein [Geothermobacter ehrlichii]TYO99329.1 histidine kinase/DNA gyrase B/HSP90-like ATPase [Geothermobacter ehrlichii]